MPLGVLGWTAVAGVVIGGASAIDAHQQASKAMSGSDPFRYWRPGYGEQLHDLMNNPASIQNDPEYKFRMDQGMEAVTRSGAAKGLLDSGNIASSLLEYGQGFSTTFLRDQEKFLAQLAGSGISPNAAAGVQAAQNDFNNYGDVLASLGFAATNWGRNANSGSYGGTGYGSGSTGFGGGGYGGVGVNSGANGGSLVA